MSESTIKVRLAVAVNTRGDWEAQGSSAYQRDDQDRAAVAAIRELQESSDDRAPAWLYWVEVEVPIPSKAAIRGRIVPDSERAAEAKESR